MTLHRRATDTGGATRPGGEGVGPGGLSGWSDALDADPYTPPVFLIASSGRSGTAALTYGLTMHSDTEVAHEPDPLLHEAWLKHRRRPYWTKTYRARMADYKAKARSGQRYGESFRTSNLVPDVMRQVGTCPLLVLARDPEGYVKSAHSRQVLSKNDQWDQWRLVPRRQDPDLPLALRIADHWITVNRYLLNAVDRYSPSRVVLHQPLDPVIDDWADFLGITITKRAELSEYLSEKPNKSLTFDLPEGFELVAERCHPMWEELQSRAT